MLTNDPGTWLAGDRTTTVSQLAVSLIDLRLHLQNRLDGGHLDGLLRSSTSRWIFLATKIREVSTWATSVRQASERTMRLGVLFSEVTGACVSLGWHAEHERHSLPVPDDQGGSAAPRSAAFMSGFYVFARDPQPEQVGAVSAIQCGFGSLGQRCPPRAIAQLLWL